MMETNFQATSAAISELTTNETENEMNQELNDAELDAIAGGIPTIYVNGPAPISYSPDAFKKRYGFLFGL